MHLFKCARLIKVGEYAQYIIHIEAVPLRIYVNALPGSATC